MTRIFLTKEQTEEVKHAFHAKVQLCDPDGTVIRTFKHEDSPEFIAELKRIAAAPGRRFTNAEADLQFKAFQEEWHRSGGMTYAQIRAFFERFEQADTGSLVGQRNGK